MLAPRNFLDQLLSFDYYFGHALYSRNDDCPLTKPPYDYDISPCATIELGISSANLDSLLSAISEAINLVDFDTDSLRIE